MYPLFISNQHNIFYLTGFFGLSEYEREAWAVHFEDKTYLITDARYINAFEKLQKQSSTIIPKLISHEKPLRKVIQEIINDEKIRTLFFEPESLTYFEYQFFKKAFDVKFSPYQKAFSKKREIKSKKEISKIRTASHVTDKCLKEIKKTIKIDQTEKEVAFRIEFWLKKNGYDLAFDPIVAVDSHAAIPHYNTRAQGTATIEADSIILIDFGAKVDHYLSDMTRMLSMSTPSTEFQKAYDTVLEAYETSMAACKKSAPYAHIDAQTRTVVEKAGYPTFQHATGHGVGLEIHEGPKMAPKSTDTVAPGHIVTIEPGVYLQGKFGIRFEDTVVIQDDGTAKALTQSPRDLLL